MKRKRSSWLALGLALLMLLSPFPAYGSASAAGEGAAAAASSSSAGDGYVRLKNEWKGNYLYESEGKVRYGFTAIGDLSSQWRIEQSGGNVRLQNRATGHYLSMDNGVNDGGIPLAAKADTGAESMKWVIGADANPAPGSGYTVANFRNAAYATAYLNVQVQDGYAYSNGWAQPGWGSARWVLEPAYDGEPVRIRDSWKGSYLVEKDGIVQYGTPLLNDASSHWYIESGPDGKLLRNRATGHYIRMNNGPNDGDIPLAAGTAGTGWNIAGAQDGGGTALTGLVTVQSAVYADAVLNVEKQYGYPVANNWAQPTWGSAQWRLEAASDSTAMRVQDKWKGDFLYEDNGQVKYGQPDYTDTASQWAVEDAGAGFKLLKNVGTGHVVTMNNAPDSGDNLAATTAASGASSLWKMTPAKDGDGNELTGYATLQNSAFTEAYINVQQQDGYAHANNWAQGTWSSAQWKLAAPAPGGGSEEPEENPYIRIKNDWLQLYLYEQGGKVRYGNVASDNESGQWQIESANGIKRIKNRASGHYLSLEGVTSARDGLSATELKDNSTLADWIIDTYQGLKLIRSAPDGKDTADSGMYVNVENKLKVAQYGTVPKDWGSPKWDFVAVEDSVPASPYVRLKNGYRGSYLYEQEGIVKDGQPAADDGSSHWSLVGGTAGTLIVNRATGHIISSANVKSYADALESLDADRSLKTSAWTVENVAGSGLKVFSSAADSTIVIHDEDNKGFAQASNLDKSWGSAQWALEAAPLLPPELPEGEIRIKSVSGGQYLYENRDHVVLYGNPPAEDGYSHWSVKMENGAVRLTNRVTGNVLSLEHLRGYAETVAAGDTAANDRSAWALESVPGGTAVLIRSAADGLEDEYLHIQDALGYAQADLRSVESTSVQWTLEPAPEQYTVPKDPAAGMTSSTPVLADKNAVRLYSGDGNGYLTEADGRLALKAIPGSTGEDIWRFEDVNGHMRLRNEATGHLAALEADGRATVQAADHDGLPAEWRVSPYSGDWVLENASVDGAYLASSGDGVAGGAGQADAAAHWRLEPVLGDTGYEAEDAFMSGGVHSSKLAKGYTGTGVAGDWSEADARLIMAVTAPEAGDYTLKLRAANNSGTAKRLALYVNGLYSGPVTLPAGGAADEWKVLPLPAKLRAGVNTVMLTTSGNAAGVLVDSLTVPGTSGPAFRGATVPYVAYEAEQGTTNAERLGPSTNYMAIDSEASGREAVRLNQTGEYVEFTLKDSANFMTLRYAIPDAPEGGGTEATLSLYVDGQKQGTLDLNSKYAWVYGKYPWSNDPSEGDGHRFFDESQFPLEDLPAGTVIRLQKDAGDTADYYAIDLAEMEQAPDAYAMPEGYLDVTSFGAIPNDSGDDSDAFRAAIAEAQKQKKGVWVPEGAFRFAGGPLEISDVTIRGAGMWHTVIEGAGFMGIGGGIEVYDMKFDVGVTGRHDDRAEAAFDGTFGRNSILQGLWIEHAKVGVWSTLKGNVPTDGLYIAGLRIRNTYADGINLTTGTVNSMVEQTVIRGSGDDSIALWSQVPDTLTGTPQQQADAARVAGNTVRFNTVQLPWLADGVAIFGGSDNTVADNIISDTVVSGAGIAVSTRFNPVAFGGTTTVERNTLIRTGSHEFNWNQDFGGLWIFTGDKAIDGDIVLRSNNVLDSSFQGLYISGPNAIQSGHIRLENLVIEGSGTWGINAAQGVSGSVTLNNVILRNNKVGNFFNGMGSDFIPDERGLGIVSAVKPLTLALNGKQAGAFSMTAGQTAALTALAPLATGAEAAEVTADTEFTVSDASVAAVAADGTVTAVAPGVAVVTAVYSGKTVSYTLEVADAEGPQWPEGSLRASDIGATSLRLDWPAAEESASLPVSYRVSFGGRTVAAAEPSAVITGLTPSTAYTFRVEAMDAAGHWSASPLEAQATTSAAPPQEPGGDVGTAPPSAAAGTDAALQAAASAGDRLLTAGAAGAAPAITVAADPASGTAAFTAAGWQAAFAKAQFGGVKVTSGGNAYELPWNTPELLRAAGYDTAGAILAVKMAAPDTAAAEKLRRLAESAGRSLAGEAVSYELTLTTAAGTRTVSGFGGAVIARSFTVPGGLDPAVSGVAVLDPATGSFRYVPAKFVTADGTTTVTVRSMTNSIYAAVTGAVAFADLSTHWGRPDIEALAAKGLVKGKAAGQFVPGAAITRAELASLLVRGIGAAPEAVPGLTAGTFTDLAAGAWYAGDVDTAAALGIVTGFPGGAFRPGEPVTRAQLAVMLAAVLKPGGDTPAAGASEAALARYTDRADIPVWAQGAVAALTSGGILAGRASGTFAPAAPVTRAEAAVALYRALTQLQWINPIAE